MSLWTGLHFLLSGVLHRSRAEAEMDQELRFHIEAYAEDLSRKGVPREEALRQAQLEFGGVERTKEECRDQQSLRFLEVLFQDLRYAARSLRKAPGFTSVAVLTLALGIGVNTAIFSLVSGLLLRPLPYPNPQQLVSVTGAYPKGAFVAMREQIHTMDGATYSEGHEVNLAGQGEPVRLACTLVSAELLSILGARPELGRTFYPGEDRPGQDNYVILSHALWEKQFASDPSIIGRSIELEGLSREVVGVMPAHFAFPSTKTQLWLPLHNDPRSSVAYWAGDFMPVIGRLHQGSTLQQARMDIRMFQSRVGALFPWPMPANWNANGSVLELQNGMVANMRARLLMLLGAVLLVLLIACANVANLTLSRGVTREKEIALRAALGAGSRRIITQLLTESILLSTMGGLVGLLFAIKGLSLLKTVLPADTPLLPDVRLDWRVLAFTGALAVLTGFVFGLAPALRSSRISLMESLRSGGRGAAASVSHRLRSSLVIAEIAFAVLLVIAAGLLIRSFWAMSHVNPGFHSESILTARITPNESFCSDPARCLAFYRELLSQVQSSPGVSGATLINTLPLGGRLTKRNMDVEDYLGPRDQSSPLFWLNMVTPDYFHVMSISFLAGQPFTEANVSDNPPVAVVSATTARRYWPNQNAVGKHIRLLGDKEWHTVIGVISDVRAYDIQRSEPEWIEGTVYIPYSPNATLEDGRVPAEMTVAMKTTLDESQMGTMLRRVVAVLNQEVPVSEVKTMHTVISEAVSTPASTTSLFVAFAALALILGMIGTYGVLAFLVAKRTQEIGIRVALGAKRRDVLWLVMKEGARFTIAGIALGLSGAFLVTRLLASELYGVSPLDPVTYLGVALLMAVVTLLACYVPTRRAMNVDPLIALRHE
ncbi:MAG TPA: ABC transporter permease [Candidatus Acidoferrum sp.]|jgi:putative ABC transport system permease protein